MAGTAQATLTATPAKLVAAGTALRAPQGVLVESDEDNGVDVYVGFTDAVGTSTGFRLKPGKSVVCPVDDPSSVWARSASSTALVFVMW